MEGGCKRVLDGTGGVRAAGASVPNFSDCSGRGAVGAARRFMGGNAVAGGEICWRNTLMGIASEIAFGEQHRVLGVGRWEIITWVGGSAH